MKMILDSEQEELYMMRLKIQRNKRRVCPVKNIEKQSCVGCAKKDRCDQLERYNGIFYKMIDNYNDSRNFFAHIVDIGEGEVMYIEFIRGSWKYSVVSLEKLEDGED